jgi:hypothetical protein
MKLNEFAKQLDGIIDILYNVGSIVSIRAAKKLSANFNSTPTVFMDTFVDKLMPLRDQIIHKNIDSHTFNEMFGSNEYTEIYNYLHTTDGLMEKVYTSLTLILNFY